MIRSNPNVATTSKVDCQKRTKRTNFIFGRLQYPRNNTKGSTLRFLAFVGFYILCGIFWGIILSYMHCKNDQKIAYTNLIQQQRKYI